MKWIVLIVISMTIILTAVFNYDATVLPKSIRASWYSEASNLAAGYTLTMANGEELDDDKYTCASWDYPFGTILHVTNVTGIIIPDEIKTRKSVEVRITDRRPKMLMYKRGRILILSKAAFSKIASLERDSITVKIEVVK